MSLPPGYPSPSLAAQYDQGFLAQAWDEQCRLRARQKAHKNTALRAKGKSTAPPMPKQTDGGCLSRLAAAFGFGKKGLKSCLRGGGDKGGRKRQRSVSFAEAPPAVVLVPNGNRGKKASSVSCLREVGPGGIASMGGGRDLSSEALRPDAELDAPGPGGLPAGHRVVLWITNPDPDNTLSDATTVAPGSDADSVVPSDSDSIASSTSSTVFGEVRSDATTVYPSSDSDSVISSTSSTLVSDVLSTHVHPSIRYLPGTDHVPSRLYAISEAPETYT